MRGPNPLCRTIFEVRDVSAPAPPPVPPPAAVPAPPGLRSGSVGDMVPILSAEIAAPDQSAPPTARKPAAAPRPAAEPIPIKVATPMAEVQPAAADPEVSTPTAAQQTALDEFFGGAAPVAPTAETAPEPTFFAEDSAPPVRQQILVEAPPPSKDGVHVPLPAVPTRKWQRSVLILLLLLIVTIATTWWLLSGASPGDESGRWARAEKDYKDRNFADAATGFRALVADFPESEQRAKYQFYAELSELRDQVERTHAGWEETRACIEKLYAFVEVYQTDLSIENHKKDLADSLYKLVQETTDQAGLDKDRVKLKAAEKMNADAQRFGPPTEAQAKAIKETMAAVRYKVETAEVHDQLLAQLGNLEKEPSADAVLRARQLGTDDVLRPLAQKMVGSEGPVTETAVKDMLLKLRAEVRGLTSKIQIAHRAAVKFGTEWAGEALTEMAEDTPASLLVLPYLSPVPLPPKGARDRPVFAVVRGVLYAFDPGSGRLRWARRLGVDSQTLPVWLPGTALAPEVVLVASTDYGGLAALDGQSGAVLWFLPLADICHGQPAVVGQRAYVARRDGVVFEIDTAGGRCLGAYTLGQSLTWQGVHQPRTNFVYFAADHTCLYALDIVQRRCEVVVYSDHTAGALLCGPVVVPLPASGAGAPHGRLLLSVAKGPAMTDVLSYALPLTDDPEQQPALLRSLPGRLWFPPGQNGEFLAIVSDTGTLALFGIKQPNTLDPDLFSLPATNYLPGGPSGSPRFSAQVVHVDSSAFWVLANQELHCLRTVMDGKTGWSVDAQSLGLKALGTPLHDSQVQANREGGYTLFTVTEAPDGSSCWMSAIDAQRGVLLWKRQIGWMCKGQPVAVGTTVLGRDTNGLLLHIDRNRLTVLPGSDWHVTRNLGEVLSTDDDASWLLPAPDGKTVYVLAVHKQKARVSRFEDGSFAQEVYYNLDARPRGTPALVDDFVVLPLDNGRLCRLLPSAKDKIGKVAAGEMWRSKDADARADGHVVALGKTLFASTDGSSGLTLWRRAGDDWQKGESAKVGGRIIAPPVMVALAGKPGEWALGVADNGPGVTLLHVEGLRKLQHWAMSDKITAGPFVRGHGIGLILGGRRLVWLDPLKSKPHFAYTFRADVVGQPELVDGVLIVADRDGRFQGIDPWAKTFVGAGYVLEANVAAAAAPVPFGEDRLLVPLTDGTTLLLARQWFRPRLLGLSTVRPCLGNVE
jgi:hypothetical protein